MRVAGFGFRAAASSDSLADALDRAGGPAGVSALAAPADKAGAAALAELAARLRLPVRAVAQGRLAAMPTLTEAPRVRAARATGSVAEAAALAAAGPGAHLTGPRAISADRTATCAIARRPGGGPVPAETGPATGTPATGTPGTATGTPVTSTPVTATPATATSATGAPTTATHVNGAPTTGTHVTGTHVTSTPATGAPASRAPTPDATPNTPPPDPGAPA